VREAGVIFESEEEFVVRRHEMPARKEKKKTSKEDPLFRSRPKNFRVGGDVLPKRDLSRYVKWPLNVRVQRQKRVLMQRLKVPPSVNQFGKKLEKSNAVELYKLLGKYRPESAKEKKDRLKKLAAEGGKQEKAPPVVKFGLHHVTTLIEEKKAKLVVIACDVEPLELVIWMPALCRKMNVPYCIVNNKGRLGRLVYQRNASCVALTEVQPEDQAKLATVQDVCRAQFNDNKEALKKWGGGIMGLRTQKKLELREKALEVERLKKEKMLG